VRYVIQKGKPVFLLEDAPPSEYVTMFSERTIYYAEDDRFFPNVDKVVLRKYMYFHLPKNDRGYTVLAVDQKDVELLADATISRHEREKNALSNS
jgi:hypothetical protein